MFGSSHLVSLFPKVAEKILNGADLEFYKWDADIKELLAGVKAKLNKVAEVKPNYKFRNCIIFSFDKPSCCWIVKIFFSECRNGLENKRIIAFRRQRSHSRTLENCYD